MRCLACDCGLSDREATRKGETTGEFLDLCDHCFATIADQITAVDSPFNAGQEETEYDAHFPTGNDLDY